MIDSENNLNRQIDLEIVKSLLAVEAIKAPNEQAKDALVGFLNQLQLATADHSSFVVKGAEGVYHLHH